MYRVKRISSKKQNPCPAINVEWNECCYITRNGKVVKEKNQGGEHPIFLPRPKEVNRYHKKHFSPILYRFLFVSFFFVSFIYYTYIMLKGLQYFICRSHVGHVDFLCFATRKIFKSLLFYFFYFLSHKSINTLRSIYCMHCLEARKNGDLLG